MNRRLQVPKVAAPKLAALLYLRVSSKEQLQNLSIQTQRASCEEYCKKNGLNIVGEFQETASAKTAKDRPQFQAMLRCCEQRRGEIGAVVVYSVSRFARNVGDYA